MYKVGDKLICIDPKHDMVMGATYIVTGYEYVDLVQFVYVRADTGYKVMGNCYPSRFKPYIKQCMFKEIEQ